MNHLTLKILGEAAISLIIVLLCLCGSAKEVRNIPPIQNNTNLFREIRNSDSVIIYWDAPSLSNDSVKFYELSYRTPRQTNWTLLKSNISPSANPEVVIHRNEIASTDSLFYFGIRYVNKSDSTSDYHLSSDPTAVPPTGWFLIWTH